MTTFINWCLILTVTAIAYWILTLIPFFQMDYHERVWRFIKSRQRIQPRNTSRTQPARNSWRHIARSGSGIRSFLHGFLYDSPYYPLDSNTVHAEIPSLWRAQEPKRLAEMGEHEGYAATYSHYVFWAIAAICGIPDAVISVVAIMAGFSLVFFAFWVVLQATIAVLLASVYLHRLLSARIIFSHGFLYKNRPFKASWTSEEDSSFGRITGGPYGNVFWQRVFRRVPPWFWPGRIKMQAKESQQVLLSISPVHYSTHLRLLLDDVRVRFEASQGRIADHQERQSATLGGIHELLQRMADRYDF